MAKNESPIRANGGGVKSRFLFFARHTLQERQRKMLCQAKRTAFEKNRADKRAECDDHTRTICWVCVHENPCRASAVFIQGPKKIIAQEVSSANKNTRLCVLMRIEVFVCIQRTGPPAGSVTHRTHNLDLGKKEDPDNSADFQMPIQQVFTKPFLHFELSCFG